MPIPAGLREGDEFEIDLDDPPAVPTRGSEPAAELVQPPSLPTKMEVHFGATGRELRTAAQRDDRAALTAALKHADVNSADLKTGNTALHWAAVLDHPKIVLALLNANADMSLRNRNSATAWDQAVAKGGRKHVLQLLNGERPDLDATPEEEPDEEPEPEPEPEPVERVDSSRLMFELANRAAEADEEPDPEPEPEPEPVEEAPVEPKRRRKKTLTAPPPPPPLALVLPAKDLRAAVFRKVDAQANGLLTLAEAKAAVSEIWPSFDRQPVLMRAYHALQVTEAGQIGRKEFRRLLKYIVYFNSNWMDFEEVLELARASGGRKFASNPPIACDSSVYTNLTDCV